MAHNRCRRRLSTCTFYLLLFYVLTRPQQVTDMAHNRCRRRPSTCTFYLLLFNVLTRSQKVTDMAHNCSRKWPPTWGFSTICNKSPTGPKKSPTGKSPTGPISHRHVHFLSFCPCCKEVTDRPKKVADRKVADRPNKSPTRTFSLLLSVLQRSHRQAQKSRRQESRRQAQQVTDMYILLLLSVRQRSHRHAQKSRRPKSRRQQHSVHFFTTYHLLLTSYCS